MEHQNKTNSVDINKILAEAKSRKPLMELEEIENIIHNKSSKRRRGDYGKGKAFLALLMVMGIFTARYFFVNETKSGTDQISVSEGENSGNKNFSPALEREGKTDAEFKRKQQLENENRAANNTAKNNHQLSLQENKQKVTKHENIETKNVKMQLPNSANDVFFNEQIFVNNNSTKFTLKGWKLSSKVPAQFNYGLDKEVTFEGNAAAYIRSQRSNYNSAWLTQEISAAPYAGKRVKLSAMVKSSNAGKKAWAGIFMNVKGKDFKTVGYDNLYNKNISGQSDWVRCELVMDLPEESNSLHFGLYKVYGGMAWIDDVNLEVVSVETPLQFVTQTEAHDTSLVQPDIASQVSELVVEEPANLNFEKYKNNELPKGWFIGEEKQHYRAVADEKNARSGKSSALLQSNGYVEKDWNTLMQYCKAHSYEGARLKLTAWVRSEDLISHASFVFRVEGVNAAAPENIKEMTFTGNNNWRKVELILDIPEGATYMSYGLFLTGKGKVWMDDISIEEVAVERKKISWYKTPVNLGFEE